MGDRLRTGKPPRSMTSHSGQLRLLPSAERKMSTGSDALRLASKGRFIPLVDERVGGRYNCVIPR